MGTMTYMINWQYKNEAEKGMGGCVRGAPWVESDDRTM